MRQGWPDYCMNAGIAGGCERKPTTVYWSAAPILRLCAECWRAVFHTDHPQAV